MPDVHAPATQAELCDVIATAAAHGTKLKVQAGGSKDVIGAPTPAIPVLDLRGFDGVVDYDPPELVLTVGSGTPLAEVEALLAAENQMLAFEPWDHGRMLGKLPGAATIGGVVAAGVSGPRRLFAGGTRDHVLGFKAVNGRGEAFTAGARVVKNVTGFDLPKLITGSWGRLVALTQVTLKVVPAPEARATLFLDGLGPEASVAAMARALGSPAGVVAAACLPNWQENPITLLRLEGFRASLPARCDILRSALAGDGPPGTLEEAESDALWRDIRDAGILPRRQALWRVVLSPRRAPAFIRALGEADWLLDWGGALVWASTDADPDDVRASAAAAGGHATLVRADSDLRRAVSTFHPPAPGIGTIERNLRRTFDPQQVFETGRF